MQEDPFLPSRIISLNVATPEDGTAMVRLEFEVSIQADGEDKVTANSLLERSAPFTWLPNASSRTTWTVNPVLVNSNEDGHGVYSDIDIGGVANPLLVWYPPVLSKYSQLLQNSTSFHANSPQATEPPKNIKI